MFSGWPEKWVFIGRWVCRYTHCTLLRELNPDSEAGICPIHLFEESSKPSLHFLAACLKPSAAVLIWQCYGYRKGNIRRVMVFSILRSQVFCLVWVVLSAWTNMGPDLVPTEVRSMATEFIRKGLLISKAPFHTQVLLRNCIIYPNATKLRCTFSFHHCCLPRCLYIKNRREHRNCQTGSDLWSI